MLIGLCGLIGSGKGTVADRLVSNHNFTKLSFADKLKDGVAAIFEWPRDMLEGDTEKSRAWREQPDKFWSQELGENITPRYVLQKFGTEVRNGFHLQTWVILVKKTILENPSTNFVIPDVRFPHEVDLIKSMKGQMILVKRGEDPNWFTAYKDKDIVPNNIHPSEYLWAKTKFDTTIFNNASISKLHDSVLDNVNELVI